MWFMNLPETYPIGVLAVALLWSSYQGFVGCVAGQFICDKARMERPLRVTRAVRFWAYAFPHAILYFMASLSGFAAWWLITRLADSIGNWASIGGGTGALLIALASVMVSGITGALPRILYLGGRP